MLNGHLISAVITEVAIAASMAGVRSMTMMKMVGLNVASDPLFTAGWHCVNVWFCYADDPGIYSSQNEQDNEMIARAAMVPLVVEPSDSEARYFAKERAYELSENMIHRLFLEQLHVLHIHRDC